MKPPVWSGDWPIPPVVRLPGLRVRVRVLPPEKMPADTAYGCFDYRTPTNAHPAAVIYISSAWPVPVQRYILWHELIHAVNDGLDQMIEKFPEQVQTHSMAAMAALKMAEVTEAVQEVEPSPST